MEYLNRLRGEVREAIIGQDMVRAVLDGKADPAGYIRYLENVWHYAQHSSIVIGLAGARCVPVSEPLADYLLHHAREELGHDQWALDDLAGLGVPAEKVRASRPVPACAAMIGVEYYVAGHGNPVGIFGWLFVLESMGDDLGHAVSAQVAEGLKLPDSVKFLAGHGDADADHTRDIIEQIEANISGPDLDEVHHIADVMADLYVRIFAEIGEGK